MQHSDQIKAQVIVEWQAGSSLNALVAKYDVPKSTVQSWTHGLERVGLAPSPGPKKKSLSDLSYELASESFNAAIAILRLAQDREWLIKQNANDLAILFGVNADKLYRLLPAFVGPNATDGIIDAGGDREGASQPS